MAETLPEFLVRRRREIENEARVLSAQIEKLDEEREQLATAAKAVGVGHIFSYDPDAQMHEEAVQNAARRSGKVASERTIKEAVLEILDEFSGGMTALEILAAINTRFGFDYPRTSLSPQLSRLKSDGFIIRDGMNWRLPSSDARTNEAVGEMSQPDAPTASVTDTTAYGGGVFN